MKYPHHRPTASRIGFGLGLLVLAALACSLPVPAPKPTPTPPLAANEIRFTQALYTCYLQKGGTLPGANVQYVDQSGDTYQLLIDGQRADKKRLDSLYWKGQPVGGVTLEFNLRILGVFLDQFEASGPVNITIADPAPQAGVAPPGNAELHYTVDLVDFKAAKGANFPGTTVGYAGKTDKGAQLTGVEGYAYRQSGDSIDWEGQVRDNVWIELNLRVSTISDDSLSTVGTGELWVVTH